MKSLRYLLASIIFFIITNCSNIGVGGSVSGGSSGDVNVGVGVGIQLYSPEK